MDLFFIIIRTIFFYFLVLIVFRIMGKREIGQLSILDLVVSLLIAELVAISIENYNDSILFTTVPIIILLFFELLSGYLSLKFNKFRNIVDGKPSLIINGGIINHKEMIKQRYTLDDLMLELRNNGIEESDTIVFVVDAKDGLTTNDLLIRDMLKRSNKKVIVEN